MFSPGIELNSSSPEPPSYTTRPPSHNSTSEYVVYMDTASCGFGVKCLFVYYSQQIPWTRSKQFCHPCRLFFDKNFVMFSFNVRKQ